MTDEEFLAELKERTLNQPDIKDATPYITVLRKEFGPVVSSRVISDWMTKYNGD
jgi:hypothetical protein